MNAQVCLLLSLMFAASLASAQGEDMMAKMKKFQACIEKVDQSELNRLEQEVEALQPKLDALCQQGKRNKAQKMAVELAKKMSATKTMQQVKQCAKIAEDIMPTNTMFDMEAELKNKNICELLAE